MQNGNFIPPSQLLNFPELPDLDEIGEVLVLRTPGSASINESIGIGFLTKNHHLDFKDFISPDFALVLLLRGSGLYVDAVGREYPLSAGSTFMRLPDVAHSNYVNINSGYVECCIELGPRLYEVLTTMGFLQTSPPVHRIELGNFEIPRRI